MDDRYKTITEEEVEEWLSLGVFDCTINRFTEILNGEYSLNDARNDILSFRPKIEEP